MKKRRLGLGFVALVVGVMAGLGVVMAGEPVVGESAGVSVGAEKVSWVMVEGRFLKNGVQVSKPTLKTLSGRAIEVTMQAWDKDGASSFIMIDFTPVVVGKEVEVKGEVAVAHEKEAKDKVVARVDERVKGDGVLKVPVKLNEDEYLFEFRFGVVAGE